MPFSSVSIYYQVVNLGKWFYSRSYYRSGNCCWSNRFTAPSKIQSMLC